MECLYLPEIDEATRNIEPSDAERKHIRALRLKQNEEIMVTNGKGYCFFARINFDKLQNPTLIIEKSFENFGEEPSSIDILVCNLSDKTRLEWIIEKSTELGVANIFIKNCRYSQVKNIDLKRLTNKAISAIKQCKRAVLPTIQIIESKLLIPKEMSEKYKSIVLLDENGNNPTDAIIGSPLLIIVGPEGGLHPTEIEFLNKLNPTKWRIGNRRLRTETAIISALSIALTKL